MFEPNQAEVRHFIRRFRTRRRRVLRMLTFGLLLPVVLAVLVYYKRGWFFVHNDLMSPTPTAYLLAAVLVLTEVAIIAMFFVFWRCGHCETFAGFHWNPAVCSHCGGKLRRAHSSRSRHDDEEYEYDDDEQDEEDDHDRRRH